MKTNPKIQPTTLLTLGLIALATPSHAQIYQITDPQTGKITFTDKTPSDTSNSKILPINTQPTPQPIQTHPQTPYPQNIPQAYPQNAPYPQNFGQGYPQNAYPQNLLPNFPQGYPQNLPYPPNLANNPEIAIAPQATPMAQPQPSAAQHQISLSLDQTTYRRPIQTMQVQAHSTTALQNGDKIILLIDNKPVAEHDKTPFITSLNTVDIDPGDHQITAIVQNKQGQTLASTAKTFYLIQHTQALINKKKLAEQRKKAQKSRWRR